ncbi:unnamed protein product [Cylicocyclus nassatus]|uniref:Uncharacterized protein n=1 Tax=Cylicocyclus nassatus TaxID=53992 RepID=A0AA36GV07_CYLNA|nr:unnamed protein product [Cylicocyclus nassatus]
MDGPESTDSEFEDVFDAYFDRYSTRNSQLLRKVDELQIEEVESLLADLYKTRRNLPLKRGHQEGTHNVLLANMGVHVGEDVERERDSFLHRHPGRWEGDFNAFTHRRHAYLWWVLAYLMIAIEV